ncbi:DNA polymerase IV [Thalassospiraceae bacterium LMO-SO8]|nr:DNA polymerase IV [Thalassospiraceae bacterium LMO-SO8]
MMTAVCRDCATLWEAPPGASAGRCPQCGGRRVFCHPELASLTLAHIDCDAFYASVEKRDNPAIAGRPVIVGGGRRGVVAACCYIARISGVRSAMPMFQALKRCPKAVVIRPDMEKYRRAGHQIRAMMEDLTPLVEPISIDEAFLDLAGTQALHKGPPAVTLVRLVKRIEDEVGVTASVGLSYNKFLAKVASDLDKPRGFAAIGRADAADFLRDRPVGLIWGVGGSLRGRLEKNGVTRIGDLLRFDERDLTARYGAMGSRLYNFARGQDDRRVTPGGDAKSVSAETTFDEDIGDLESLKAVLWRLSEKVSSRLKGKGIEGGTVVLKLKTDKFRQLTRSRRLDRPTQLAEAIYRAALPLLEKETDGTRFRLIGTGVQNIAPLGAGAPETGDLLAGTGDRPRKVEEAMDRVRGKFGVNAIKKGRSL